MYDRPHIQVKSLPPIQQPTDFDDYYNKPEDTFPTTPNSDISPHGYLFPPDNFRGRERLPIDLSPTQKSPLDCTVSWQSTNPVYLPYGPRESPFPYLYPEPSPNYVSPPEHLQNNTRQHSPNHPTYYPHPLEQTSPTHFDLPPPPMFTPRIMHHPGQPSSNYSHFNSQLLIPSPSIPVSPIHMSPSELFAHQHNTDGFPLRIPSIPCPSLMVPHPSPRTIIHSTPLTNEPTTTPIIPVMFDPDIIPQQKPSYITPPPPRPSHPSRQFSKAGIQTFDEQILRLLEGVMGDEEGTKKQRQIHTEKKFVKKEYREPFALKESKRNIRVKKAKYRFEIRPTSLWFNGRDWSLNELDSVYAKTSNQIVLTFRKHLPIHFCFHDDHIAEEKAAEIEEKATKLRTRRLEREICSVLQSSISKDELAPGVYVKISESLLGNSTETTARVLWIHADIITVKLPEGSARLPKWYVSRLADPYDIERLRTNADELSRSLMHTNQEDMIPELQALRENLNRTVDWICQDYFEQWSDKVYLGGHPVTQTEICRMVDCHILSLYLKQEMEDIRSALVRAYLSENVQFSMSICNLSKEPFHYFCSDPSLSSVFNVGKRLILRMMAAGIYERLKYYVDVVDNYTKQVPNYNEPDLLSYLLYCLVKACHSSHRPRLILAPFDLLLVAELAHPSCLADEKLLKSINYFERVFDAINSLPKSNV